MSADPIKLFLCGDVMTGRGIDQVLPHPNEPQLYEAYAKSAQVYVELAEAANGPIPKPVDFAYIWGDALDVLRQAAPDARLINLETAVTRSADYWAGKGIHYRMNPDNLACLGAAGVDCCALANNHVLDWGYAGLAETLDSLAGAGIATAGAGADIGAATAPALIALGGESRLMFFSMASASSGVPREWAASTRRAGVSLVDEEMSEQDLHRFAARVRALRRPHDIVVVSLHWGGNWGYRIQRKYSLFAHRLIDEAGVDLIHGHSSHHPKGLEVYRDKLILYGCGDFLNDYEGISGYEAFRGDLSLMYFASLDRRDRRLLALELVPMQIRRFRLNRAGRHDVHWLRKVLDRESRGWGARIVEKDEYTLMLRRLD